MIGKLSGKLESAAPGEALVDVAGVGYLVRVPLSLDLRAGEDVSLHIYTAVREDAIDLYGFATGGDISFFKQLMSVSGIGPKTALSIMGVSDTQSLRRHIAAGDATALVKVFGIGKKSAERIVVELRDKVMSDAASAPSGVGAKSSEDFEVIEALMALGYRADESRDALKNNSGKGVKERLGAALKHLGSR